MAVVEWIRTLAQNDILEGVVSTLISAGILAWITPILKNRRRLLMDRVWFALRYFVFLVLLALLLFLNSSAFKWMEEGVALSSFLLAALIFEAFLKRQAIHQQSRSMLRVLFNVSVIYVLLHSTAEKFDQTEIITIVEFSVLNLIFEFLREKGKKVKIDGIRYELNCKVNRSQLKALFSSNEIQLSNVNRVVSRTFLHVAAFVDTAMVGFVNLIWSGVGPGEVDYLSTNPNVRGVAKESLKLLEAAAKEAGITEIQISNKVIKSNDYLDEILSDSPYQPERCLVRQLDGGSGASSETP